MVVGNETKSVTLASYYPATLNPIFMGAHPPTRYDFPYDSSAQRVTYFQNYRNETLSRFVMPPYDWGVQKSPYSPKPDIVAGVKGRNLDRLLAVPFNDIETVDSVRLKEIDDFYKVLVLSSIIAANFWPKESLR
ncbi:uncharacterized protein [Venturia canescens]|uniref:uncharacterized protein n=1 Tax=Venturia canescens TaxID=32260 RepID=UPI001C9C3E6D|nr:uncharacterized protein LOC122412859 [Venturia canescens]